MLLAGGKAYAFVFVFLIISMMGLLPTSASILPHSHVKIATSNYATNQNWSQTCFGVLYPQPTDVLGSKRIAVVEPVFTTTAYSNSFYVFYSAHKDVPDGTYVMSDLNRLNVPVVHAWGKSQSLVSFMNSAIVTRCGLRIGGNVVILDDINVTQGALFYPNGTSRFDSVIVGFSEYVTEQEYVSFEKFVSQGGTLVIMDATNFLAEVSYNRANDHVSLTKGHGWAFDGSRAWKSVYDRWASNDTNWIGSNYCCFTPDSSANKSLIESGKANASNLIGFELESIFGEKIATTYHPHEENALTNATDSVIAYFGDSKGRHVAAYSHVYRNGLVIHFGVMGDDILTKDSSTQAFLVLALIYDPRVWPESGLFCSNLSCYNSIATPYPFT